MILNLEMRLLLFSVVENLNLTHTLLNRNFLFHVIVYKSLDELLQLQPHESYWLPLLHILYVL